jgi:hypothetical protein
VHFVNIPSSLESGEIPSSQPDVMIPASQPDVEMEATEPALMEISSASQEPSLEEPVKVEPPKEEVFEYVLPEDIKSIDQISNKFKNGYYHSLDRLLADLQFLV